MAKKIKIYFDNYAGFKKPALFVQQPDGKTRTVLDKQTNEYGHIFELSASTRNPLLFRFGEEDGSAIEDEHLTRYIAPVHFDNRREFWCRSWNLFVYTRQPQLPHPTSAEQIVEQHHVYPGVYASETDGRFALGATPTEEGVLFSLFHPHAARVYLTGDFNDWQFPGKENANPKQFLQMTLHQGYFGVPNIWMYRVNTAQVGQEYKFYVEYDALAAETVMGSRLMVDPYARYLGVDYEQNNSVIINPAAYEWHDEQYRTPAIHDLIIYELHVHGFTYNHPDIKPEHQGTYQGIIDRLNAGYFDQLGTTCLYLMPLAEVPTPQGEDALGYNSSLFMALERDFGTPDDLRRMVDTAHQHGLAVITDQVFNHSANSWNPLWKYILDHPDEAVRDDDGGIYFSGSSPWGNRLSTERTETQNMLIDTCKMMLVEYHIDGFRFDATNSMYIDHAFLHRLADELQAFKPDVILIAENLPNETDLNRQGYNGFGQWCDFFHDTIKALLREGQFEGTDNHPERLGDIFYFSKGKFAAHTNNVVNYCESHDEHSVAHEISFVEALNTPQAKDRKARLGLFATMVALGQPMIYMGQELGSERARNLVYYDFPADLANHGFYQWASRLIQLRKRYPGLRLHGFNPIEDRQFRWILGPWMEAQQGGGHRVLGWRSTPTPEHHEQIIVLLNLENHPVEVDVHFTIPGKWVRLASIDAVNDIAPIGTNHADAPETLVINDILFHNFVLPDSSAFIYKWEANL